MKLLKSVITLSILAITTQAFSKNIVFHFSDSSGPSQVTGDCGGISVWLDLNVEKAQFTGGKFNEFEGDCQTTPFEIVNIEHNPSTGSLSFYANYQEPGNFIKFVGKYFYKKPSIEGSLFQINKKTLQPVSDYKRDVILEKKAQ